MKKDFKTIKNLILLIASALTLVAVTFAWYSLSRSVGASKFDSNVSGSTIAVKYFESVDDGATYKELSGDLNMSDMIAGKIARYRMDVKTFKEIPIRVVMSFDGLSGAGSVAQYVYFDYEMRTQNGDVINHGEGLRLSDYTSGSVFAQDVSSYQKNGINDFCLYYDVYLVTEGEVISGNISLGEVKLAGQQLS